ncbi:hypothetical protein LXA43DRAFT_1098562 [Ganoderma leucocontextum]|nr:hypothetical protein LXA43DRAFT_1098562 [Ganoderma leucocontextum]
MPPPSPTSSEAEYWGEDDESWIAAASALDAPSVRQEANSDAVERGTPQVSQAFAACFFAPTQDESGRSSTPPWLEGSQSGSQSSAQDKLLELSLAIENTLDSVPLPEALGEESYMAPALQAALDELGDIRLEIYDTCPTPGPLVRRTDLLGSWIARFPLTAQWVNEAEPSRPRGLHDHTLCMWGSRITTVVCYGTVTDITYHSEIIYFKIADATGECTVRLVRTDYAVEPLVKDGRLEGLEVGVHVALVGLLILTHFYGGQSMMVATLEPPWIVNFDSISQHFVYAEVMRDLTLRIRSERRTKFIRHILLQFAPIHPSWADSWYREVDRKAIDREMLARVIQVMKDVLARARIGHPAAGCRAAHACRLALANLNAVAVVNCQYISLAIEDGLLRRWVSEDLIVDSNLLSWALVDC